jgi:tetrahydromethanopterin S-methyltransferase subunit A
MISVMKNADEISPGYKKLGAWLLKIGDFTILNPSGDVAIVTLRSELDFGPCAEKMEIREVHSRIAAYGTMMTENIGIADLLHNVLSNPGIRYLIVCGNEVKGHYSGYALLSLCRNGFEKKGRIKITRDDGQPSPANPHLPIDEEQTEEIAKRLPEQIETIDMIGETCEERVIERIKGLEKKRPLERPFLLKIKKRAGVDVDPGGKLIYYPSLIMDDDLVARPGEVKHVLQPS